MARYDTPQVFYQTGINAETGGSGLHSHYGTDKFDLVKNLVIEIPASSRRLETQPILTQSLPILTFYLSPEKNF